MKDYMHGEFALQVIQLIVVHLLGDITDTFPNVLFFTLSSSAP